MTPIRLHRRLLIPPLLLSLPYLTSSQSLVGGDLSTLPGPYGIPPSTLFSAASAPISYLAVPITGYNTTIPAGANDATGSTISGWILSISVSSDVPLVDATNDTVNKKDFMEATALEITPPPEMEVPDWVTGSWRVCAVVFVGGLKGAKGNAGEPKGGSCEGLVEGGCVQAVQVGSVSGGDGGGCEDMDVPKGCEGDLVNERGRGFEIPPSDDGDGRLFFAAGSKSFKHRGNRTLLAAAENKVWPMVLTWTHFGENGEVHDSVGWMSCIKAGGAGNASVGSRAWVRTSKWALFVVGLVMFVM